MTKTQTLTENQAEVLAIIEAGGSNGVAVDSIKRETGRPGKRVWRTLVELTSKGLVRTACEGTVGVAYSTRSGGQ